MVVISLSGSMTAKNCLFADQIVFLAGGGSGESARAVPKSGMNAMTAVKAAIAIPDFCMTILRAFCQAGPVPCGSVCFVRRLINDHETDRNALNTTLEKLISRSSPNRLA